MIVSIRSWRNFFAGLPISARWSSSPARFSTFRTVVFSLDLTEMLPSFPSLAASCDPDEGFLSTTPYLTLDDVVFCSSNRITLLAASYGLCPCFPNKLRPLDFKWEEVDLFDIRWVAGRPLALNWKLNSLRLVSTHLFRRLFFRAPSLAKKRPPCKFGPRSITFDSRFRSLERPYGALLFSAAFWPDRWTLQGAPRIRGVGVKFGARWPDELRRQPTDKPRERMRR